MRRSGLVFRFLVLLTACVFAGGTLIGDVSWAQSQPLPLVLRGAQDRLPPTRDFSFLASNYTEILIATRGGTEVMVTNRRGMIGMPGFGSGQFELQRVRWVDRPRSQQDGFFVNETTGIVGKRLLDSEGRAAGALLITAREMEVLFDLDHDGLVELSVLNSADGFVRASFTGEEGRATLDRLLSGENPFCVSAPRSSTMPERARGDASGCPPSQRSSGAGAGGTGSGAQSVPDPLDIICAGYDSLRGRRLGGRQALDPDDPLPVTEGLLDLARNGFDGEQDDLAAAGRFVLLSPVIGLVALYEFGAYEIAGGGQIGLIYHGTEHLREDAEAEPAPEGEPETPPDTDGSDTSRPGPEGGEDIGGGLAAVCGSRSQPSQSASFQTAFEEALNECPNPVENTAAAGDATAQCMNGSISRPRGPRSPTAITEETLEQATENCEGGEGRMCEPDRLGRMRRLRSLASTYLGSRAVCDPATCQPPLE
jgi:hypothetical protein